MRARESERRGTTVGGKCAQVRRFSKSCSCRIGVEMITTQDIPPCISSFPTSRFYAHFFLFSHFSCHVTHFHLRSSSTFFPPCPLSTFSPSAFCYVIKLVRRFVPDSCESILLPPESSTVLYPLFLSAQGELVRSQHYLPYFLSG